MLLDQPLPTAGPCQTRLLPFRRGLSWVRCFSLLTTMRKSTSKRREAEQRRRRVNPAKIFSDRESNHGQADFFSAGFFGFGIKRIFGGLFDGKHEWATQIV